MAFDRVALIVKVGDKQTAPGKEYLGIKDGMPICYIDEKNWKQSLDEILSSEMQRIFGCVQVSRNLLPKIKDWLLPIGIDEDGKVSDKTIYRPRKALINLAELETKTGILNLESSLRSKVDVVPLINGLELTDLDFTGTPEIPNEKIINDINLITSGAANIGSGETYTVWSAAGADLGNLTGNLTFTETTLTDESAPFQITEDLVTFRLRCTSDTPHLGDPTKGHLISRNFDGSQFRLEQEGANGTFEMEHLYMKRIDAGVGNFFGVSIGAITTATKIELHDLLIDTNGKAGHCIEIRDNTPICDLWNMKMWGTGLGLLVLPGNALNKYENMTVDDASVGGFRFDGNPGTMKNCVATNAFAGYIDIGGLTRNNLASEDGSATGTDAITGITPANEYNVDDTNSSFLRVKPGGSLENGGTSVSIAANTTGMRGNPRPHNGNNSIGGDEFGVPITGTGAANMPIMTAAGIGTLVVGLITGTGAASMPIMTAAGTGKAIVGLITGSGAAGMPIMKASGTGTVTPGVLIICPASELLDSIRDKIIGLIGFSATNVLVGDIIDISKITKDNTYAIEILSDNAQGLGNESQRDINNHPRYDIHIHQWSTIPDRVSGADMKALMCLAYTIVRRIYSFHDDSQASNPPCTGFLNVLPDYILEMAYQIRDQHINMAVLNIGFRLEAKDTEL